MLVSIVSRDSRVAGISNSGDTSKRVRMILSFPRQLLFNGPGFHEPAVVVAHVNLVQIAGQRHLSPVRSTRIAQGIFGDNLRIDRGGRCYG